MDDKQDETSLACILNELRKTNEEDLAIPVSEFYNTKTDIDVLKYTFDPTNRLNEENVPDVIQELAPSTSIIAENAIGNVHESTLESNRVQIVEQEAEMSNLLSYKEQSDETERAKLVQIDQLNKSADCDSSTDEALAAADMKKPKKSNHGIIFKKKLKSPHPVGIKKPKNADDNSPALESPSQQSNRSVKPLYSLGEIVWAKIAGYSHWPAMIDEDPDVRWHFWPADSLLPTHYHVVFFDTNNRLSRSWVKPANIKLFTEVIRVSNSRPKEYIERFKKSVNEAKIATKMPVKNRLKKYSFKERVNLPGIKLCQD